jgi:hypothetical protein
MHKQRLFIVIAGVLGIIAAFLPWAKVSFFGITASVSGTDGGDGWISLGLFAAAIGIAAATGDRNGELEANMKKAVGGIGAGAVGFMLIELVGSIGFDLASYGVYLSLLAGVVVMAIPFAVKGDGTFEVPNKETIKEDLK